MGVPPRRGARSAQRRASRGSPKRCVLRQNRAHHSRSSGPKSSPSSVTASGHGVGTGPRQRDGSCAAIRLDRKHPFAIRVYVK
jgi:hypothetical protein